MHLQLWTEKKRMKPAQVIKPFSPIIKEMGLLGTINLMQWPARHPVVRASAANTTHTSADKFTNACTCTATYTHSTHSVQSGAAAHVQCPTRSLTIASSSSWFFHTRTVTCCCCLLAATVVAHLPRGWFSLASITSPALSASQAQMSFEPSPNKGGGGRTREG